jgi:hypothetical protein
MDEAVAALSRYNQIEARARRIVAGLPANSPPLQPPMQTPALPHPAGPPPHDSPVCSVPPGSAFTRANEPAMLERPSELEQVLPSEPDIGGPWDGTAASRQVSLSARADGLASPVRSSAPESVLPPLSPAQEGPVAVAQAIRPDMPTHASGPDATTWKSIEILFLSDHRVQIRNGAKSETLNYAEFGFKDGRSEKPNQAWEALRVLATEGGTIRDAAKMGGKWPKVEKRVQEIRKAFRKHFLIPADPIPFVEGTGYQALFKISCGPSFQT